MTIEIRQEIEFDYDRLDCALHEFYQDQGIDALEDMHLKDFMIDIILDSQCTYDCNFDTNCAYECLTPAQKEELMNTAFERSREIIINDFENKWREMEVKKS